MKKRPVLPPHAINSLTLLVLLSIVLFIPITGSGQSSEVVVEYFYEDGCLNCAGAEAVVDKIVRGYDNISYSKYEIWSDYGDIKVYDRMVSEYGVASVPALVINHQVTITYSDYNGNKKLLEELLVAGIKNAPHIPVNNSVQPADGGNILPELSLPVVLVAGLLAGFNPCLLAVMAFLASLTLSSKGNRTELLKIVGGFCAGIFVMFMVVGMGLLGLIKQQPDIKDTVTLLLVVLIGLLGLWHFYDAYHLKMHDRSSFKTSGSFLQLVGGIEHRNTVMVSFFAGAMFSLIKAPCVGAVYFAILDVLITQGKIADGAIYLCFYNLGVILPVLILGIMLAFGLSPERVNDLRENRRIEMRLVTGAVLLLLAVLIYFNII
ncbi:MAG: Thiol:disulfide interchange protein DsbD [ANME-2 cluster archaeon]|nr:Thiol:disulfide interchange protein DsbD [ANME-2 cluster archaeon]